MAAGITPGPEGSVLVRPATATSILVLLLENFLPHCSYTRTQLNKRGDGLGKINTPQEGVLLPGVSEVS